jgi:hypothetical protein
VWGWPTEFKYCGVIAPDSALREWDPFMINEGFDQDDLYVEMTFLETLSKYGLRADIRQAGVDFANSQYRLWCANRAGRTNLRRGIAPPDCSHPKFNKCPTDIDYQIEADYSGLISPGRPQMVVDLGNKFGRLMNYGDGVYGGQFIGGMYAEAFFETDRVKIVEAALACIPSKSLYAEMVRDMLKWYETDPNDWKFAWKCAKAKWRDYPEYQKASNGDIDVKINGAMVLLGFLWGGGDPEKTIRISVRGGYDSDCNPSSAAGVLFASLGLRKIPKEYYSALDRARKFSFTAYDFPALVEVSEKLARQIVVASGGKIRKDKSGKEVIPCVWKAMTDCYEGLIGVKGEDGKAGFIDADGNVAIPLKWRSVWAFQDGLAIVQDSNKRLGFINRSGEVVIPCKWVRANYFVNGLAKVSATRCILARNIKWVYINRNGEVVREE